LKTTENKPNCKILKKKNLALPLVTITPIKTHTAKAAEKKKNRKIPLPPPKKIIPLEQP